MQEQKERLKTRIAQLEAQKKQYQARLKLEEKKETEKKRRARAHRLIQIGAAVESVLGRTIYEDEICFLIDFLKEQEENGCAFTEAMDRPAY